MWGGSPKIFMKLGCCQAIFQPPLGCRGSAAKPFFNKYNKKNSPVGGCCQAVLRHPPLLHCGCKYLGLALHFASDHHLCSMLSSSVCTVSVLYCGGGLQTFSEQTLTYSCVFFSLKKNKKT
jgi:hypothetical protein